MHCILSDDGKESNTAKGVSVGMELKEYKDALLNKKGMSHKMRRIQSKKHKIGIHEINKISSLCFDVIDDGIYTLAYFHEDCKKQKNILTILTDDHK